MPATGVPIGCCKGPPEMAGSVHTIILNWRTADMTIRALDHAAAAIQPVRGMIPWVDNDSGDGCVSLIAPHGAPARPHRAPLVQSGRTGRLGVKASRAGRVWAVVRRVLHRIIRCQQ